MPRSNYTSDAAYKESKGKLPKKKKVAKKKATKPKKAKRASHNPY